MSSAAPMLSVYEELGEPSRRAILAELCTGPKNVSDLVAATGLKQPNVSNHLARMRDRGLLRATKVGREVFYSFSSSELETTLATALRPPMESDGPFDLDIEIKAYAKAAILGDEAACQTIVDRAQRSGMDVLDVFEDLLTPAMRLVGTWYEVDAIEVAQEHMASSVTERVMARIASIQGAASSRRRLAVLGCAVNGWHLIGLRMVSDYLRFLGWRTMFLGANVPLESFVETVRRNNPDMVLLSCSADASCSDALALLRALRRLKPSQKTLEIGIGGGSIEGHGEAFLEAGADFTCRSLREFATAQRVVA